MTKNMKITKYSCASLTVTLLCLLGGCIRSMPTYTPPPRPPRPIDQRQSTAWQIDDGDLDKNARAYFTITTDRTTGGVHELVANGTVTSCYYSYTPSETRSVPTQYYDNSSSIWKQSWKTESRKLSSERKNWIPRQLRITNPFGGTKTVAVSDTGAFEVRIKIPVHYYLQSPKPQKYLAPVKSTRQFTIGITALSPPHGGRFKASDSMPALWQYALDTDKARQYVKNKICAVDLRFKDSTSRRGIMPKVVITGVEPSRKEVEKLLSREFDGNSALIEVASAELYGILFGGSKRTSITSNMQFKAWKGGQYKVESTHGKYHYFSAGLELDIAGKVKKNILLVEKGKKVRVENTNEGEVGSIVDAD